MQFTVEEISPDTAKQYLAAAGDNRKVSATNVSRLAAAMNAGLWQLNGETIKFNPSGKLIDGQHRLRAIISHGKPVRLAVIRGINGTAFETFDTGKNRRLPDVLSVYGYKNPIALSAIIRAVYGIKQTGNPTAFGTNTANISAPLLMQFLRATPAHDRLVEAAEESRRYIVQGSFFSQRIAGVLWFASTYSPDIKPNFWADWVSDDLRDGNPIQALRRRIHTDLTERRKMSDEEGFAISVKCWNFYCANQSVQKLRYAMFGQNSEAFPELFGVDRAAL